jgi:type IV secretion system protein VirD4
VKRKRATDPGPPLQPGFPTDIPGRPWFGLYSGDGPYADGSTGLTFAGPESSMLVLGPPRSGKTSAIVIPCVVDAPAAVVSTSTKPDVLAATIRARWQLGNCFVFDPSGSTAIPDGAVPLRWSPVTGCEEFEQATTMAHALASASRPKAALSEGAHWVERAEALLAPLLFAAALRGRDMATVCRWVLARDLREPEAVLEAQGHEMARAVLAGVTATEDRERSGIFSTAAGLLAAYRSEAALAGATEPNFDPEAFARSTDTVYICAPAHAQDQLAPLVVALLEQIRSAVYARPRNAAPVVFALDEVAGIAPLPSLPALAAEGGGQGLITLACLQDLSQARARWGDAAEGFFSLFNVKIVFPGIGDHRTLQLISALAGDEEVSVRTVNMPHWAAAFLEKRSALPTTTTSVTWRPRLSVADVARGRPGCALVIEGSAMTYAVVIPWWSHPHWSTVIRSDRPPFSHTGQLGRTVPVPAQLPPTDGEAASAR